MVSITGLQKFPSFRQTNDSENAAYEAESKADIDQAINYLFDNCNSHYVKSLLKEVKAWGAVKYGQKCFLSWDEKRGDENMFGKKDITISRTYIDLDSILAKLIVAEKATTESLKNKRSYSSRCTSRVSSWESKSLLFG